MPSTNLWEIPVALHSNLSAMALLHTKHPACVITEMLRPGKWPREMGACGGTGNEARGGYLWAAGVGWAAQAPGRP